MKILGEAEIQTLIYECRFLEGREEKIPDTAAGRCFLYVKLFDSMEKDKLGAVSPFSLEDIWCSHYFWTKLYMKIQGGDASWEDYASHILERMDQELEGEADWDFLERAEKVIEDNDSMEIILRELGLENR